MTTTRKKAAEPAITQHRVWIYGDNIDTDVIIPARYLNTSDPAELAKHCMEDIDATFVGNVHSGDVLVAGNNFGCGSSREHAPIAIKASGIVGVVAASFARIFFRNAINIGLPILECPAAVAAIQPGDQVVLDLSAGLVTVTNTGQTFAAMPYPPSILRIIQAGGLVNATREKIAAGNANE